MEEFNQNNTANLLIDDLLAANTTLQSKIKEYTIKEGKKEKIFSEDDISNILKSGLKFVYYLRQFLTQEEMIFLYSFKTKTGKNIVKEVTLTDIFQNIKVDMTNQMFEIQKLVQEIGIEHKKRKRLNINLNTFLNKIIHLGTVAKYADVDNPQTGGSLTEKYITSKAGHLHQLYQKKAYDKNVYVFYAEGKTSNKTRQRIFQRGYYYNALQNKYYNEGWLVEWGTAIYESDNEKHIQYVQNYNHQRSIELLMIGIDNEYGGLKGDITRMVQNNKNSLQRQQLQLKKSSNRHIISFQQLSTLLKKIKTLLEKIQKLQKQSIDKEVIFEKTEFKKVVEELYETTNEEINNANAELLKPLQKFDKNENLYYNK